MAQVTLGALGTPSLSDPSQMPPRCLSDATQMPKLMQLSDLSQVISAK